MLEVINTIRFRHFDKAVEVSRSLCVGVCNGFQVMECVAVLIYDRLCTMALRRRGRGRVMISFCFRLTESASDEEGGW